MTLHGLHEGLRCCCRLGENESVWISEAAFWVAGSASKQADATPTAETRCW